MHRMIYGLTILAIVGIVGLFLSFAPRKNPTVNEWSPKVSEYRDHFNSHRNSMAELENRLAESRYDEVTIFGSDKAEARFSEDGKPASKFLDAGSDWRRLLDKSKLWGVFRDGNAYFFTFGTSPFDAPKEGTFAFVHSPDSMSEVSECVAELETAAEGHCVVRLDSGWWANYFWWPSGQGH